MWTSLDQKIHEHYQTMGQAVASAMPVNGSRSEGGSGISPPPGSLVLALAGLKHRADQSAWSCSANWLKLRSNLAEDVRGRGFCREKPCKSPAGISGLGGLSAVAACPAKLHLVRNIGRNGSFRQLLMQNWKLPCRSDVRTFLALVSPCLLSCSASSSCLGKPQLYELPLLVCLRRFGQCPDISLAAPAARAIRLCNPRDAPGYDCTATQQCNYPMHRPPVMPSQDTRTKVSLHTARPRTVTGLHHFQAFCCSHLAEHASQQTGRHNA